MIYCIIKSNYNTHIYKHLKKFCGNLRCLSIITTTKNYFLQFLNSQGLEVSNLHRNQNTNFSWEIVALDYCPLHNSCEIVCENDSCWYNNNS